MNMIELSNPSTGRVFRKLEEPTKADIKARIMAARVAQRDWSTQVSLDERIECILRVRQSLLTKQDELALTLSTETGKPITQARGEIKATTARIDYFVRHVGRLLESRTPVASGGNVNAPGMAQLQEAVTYDPLGVVANISAWNYPYFVGANVFVPALLCGNAVIYKPSEYATLTGLAIESLLHDSGIPKDIFQAVIGGAQAGSNVISEAIDGLFFTGSYSTGVKIAAAVAPKLIPLQLELGGKDPAYVAEDADPVAAAYALAEGAFYNTGQSCCAVERIYVHNSILLPFRTAFMKAVSAFEIGDPSHSGTFIGPLTRREQVDVLEGQVADALAKGATLLAGGRRMSREGWYFEPTILTDTNHDMLVMKEESFGPIIGIQGVESDDEAIRLMNDTHYGLTASIYSPSRTRALQMLSRVSSGTAYWNCCDRVSPHVPWTGRGRSGLGATLSEEGIRAFIQPRAWHMKPTA